MTSAALEAISLGIGSGVAEQERNLLGRAFLVTTEYQKLDSDISNTVIGGRGHGKSAICEYFHEETRKDGHLSFLGLETSIAVGSTLTAFFRSAGGTSLSRVRWLAYIAARCATALIEENEEFPIGPIVEIEESLESLRQVVDHGVGTETYIQAIFRIAKLNRADTESLEALLESSSINLLQNLFDFLDDHDLKMNLLFDRLDEVFVSSVGAEIEAVRSLQSAANFVNKVAIDRSSGLRIKLFLRSDVERLSARRFTGAFERAPMEEIHLRWNKERISQVIWHRLAICNVTDHLEHQARAAVNGATSDERRLNLLFGETSTGMNETFSDAESMWHWILTATRDATRIYNPRFILRVIAAAVENCRGEDQVSWGSAGLPLLSPKSINQAWIKTSEYALTERVQSYSEVQTVKSSLAVRRRQDSKQFRASLAGALNLAPSEVTEFIDALELSGVFVEESGTMRLGEIFWPSFNAWD